jgi:hypothetical protein
MRVVSFFSLKKKNDLMHKNDWYIYGIQKNFSNKAKKYKGLASRCHCI